jgi:prepilin-type N-terminal cleavage/methylation domain-containing protein
MRTRRYLLASRGVRQDKGLTLIEIVGVLAVIAILACFVLTALTKQTDKAVADQESATLRAFGDALQRAILRRSYIPGSSDWATTIGAEVAMDATEVTNNVRHQQRHFIIDPSASISPPYTNTYAGSGSPAPPQNLRFIILSTLGPAFPNTLQDGNSISPGDFNTIWNWADGSPPPQTSLQGWPGTGDDLKVQRTDVSGLFVHLMLCWTASTTNAFYSINGVENANSLTNDTSTWVDSYFLQNSVLGLYTTNSNNLDSQQILVRDTSFVYFQDAWRATAAESTFAIKPFFIGYVDPSALAASFSASNPTAQTQLTNFINYMNAYMTWASANFKDSLYPSVTDAYSVMSSGLGP